MNKFKHIEQKDIKSHVSVDYTSVVLTNCDVEGCESIEQIERILDIVHLFSNYPVANKPALLDVYLIDKDSKDTSDVLLDLDRSVELTNFPLLFSSKTGMEFYEANIYAESHK